VFATGKWHNGEASFHRAFPRGRSVFFGGMDDHTKVHVCDVDNGKVSAKRTAGKFSSEEFADAAIGFLESHRGPEPFFCYVAFTAPHDPRNPARKNIGRRITTTARRCQATSCRSTRSTTA